MNLTLEIVSANGQSLGSARRKVFGPEGGRIGRASDCDWVLASPYISRHHATVRWISGTYYIESTGENGVAINAPQAMIPQRERRALRNGDRVFLDEYEVSVSIGVAAAEAHADGPMNFAPVDDPLADLVATARSPALIDPLEPAHDELDPLKQLSGGSPRRAAPAPAEVNWNHTPGMSDQFTPPAVPSGAIPADWDKTSFGRANAPAPQPSRAPTSNAPAPGFEPIPESWDETSFSRPTPPATDPVAAPVQGGSAAGVLRARGAPLPLRPAPVGQAAAPARHAPAPTRQAPAPQPDTGQTASPSADFDLIALLRASGVDPATVPAETVASFGLILRTVVQGIVEVLQARAQIKTQFRLPLTRIQTAENNPLKFSVNAEDALNFLLGRRNAAYLPPVEAFEDAFDDIRFHQMAMLAGMRAGFEHATQRFDPQRLQEVFDKRVKRGGLLQMSAKSRYWEMYAEEFRELTGDPDDAFRRLFGEVFAGAYEQQLEELKRSRRKPPR